MSRSIDWNTRIFSPQWIQSDSCKSCEPPSPVDRRLLKMAFWLFCNIAFSHFIVFLMLISSLIISVVTCSPCCLVVSIRPDWRIMNFLTENKMFYQTHFVVHSPWAVWIAAQSSLFTLERKPEPELGSIHGKASEPERRAREREKERVSQSVILPKTPLETPPTCVRLWPFCSRLILQNRKGRAKLPDPQGLLQGQP